ncbi:DUF1345 domain-containing protein [Paracraurococcus lichenis]|uniref:DUF1345 domain-containing protein n=1 Tax=Paracraurococcus lichenis TaxID=3064888 RepID=A0ABT9DYP0_9PROT|nr:DUF1345 domain-containing protein [Paracraurococcus sp. LOR1-02]MDO9708870.1 DUF1345 domain-containing protein [Paracraurococcus sp. LOR1-02]
MQLPLGLRHRPVLLAAGALGALTVGVLRLLTLPGPTAMLIGWCVLVLGYSGPMLASMHRATPEELRRRAAQLDEGEGAILAACLVAAIAALAAVGWFLSSRSGQMAPAEVGLAFLSILLSWTFVHLLFAVRYAHEYWQAGGGLDFPGEERPEFGDFLYFAFTIGMTFQTSDVAVSNRLIRQLTLVHALVAFLFNVVILAAAVNVTAGMV